MTQFHQCATCGSADVKLYRPYGEFLRDARVYCNAHVPKGEFRWYVPMIEDVDSTVWGYTSVPDDAIKLWNGLLDASDDGPHWNSGSWVVR